MSINCGPTVLDLRHERVDVNMTAGEALTINVKVVNSVTGLPQSLTGAVASAQVVSQTGVVLLPFVVSINLATSTITLSLTAAQTAALPLGPGSYEWLLSVTLQGGSPDYWVGGALSIYRTNVYSDGSGGSTVNVAIGATILATIDVGPAGAGGGGGATNLTWTAATSVVASDTGTDATITVADAVNPGLMTSANFTKLASIEAAATNDQTAAEILAKLLTVDGAASGLDADLLDGISSAGFATAAQGALATAALPRLAAGAAVENVGSIEEAVEVASVVTTKAFDAAVFGRAVYTMTGATTFSVTNPAPSGQATTFVWNIRGAFTPTLPATFRFAGTPPAYVGTGQGTSYVATTTDAGTNYHVTVLAGWA